MEKPPSIDAFGASHLGLVRRTNEDCFVVARLARSLEVAATSVEDAAAFDPVRHGEAHLWVVADGVATSGGGAVASGTAVESMVGHVVETAGCYYGFAAEQEDAFLQQLERAARGAHARIKQRGAGATTMTLVLLLWPRAYVVHVGDSRGYWWHRGRLRQFTRDQSMGELLVERGTLSEEQAQAAGFDKILGSALGGSELTVSVGLLDLEEGDALVLCTDGLTRHVANHELGPILARGHDARRTCQDLLDAALAGGGEDNVTVIVARTGEAPEVERLVGEGVAPAGESNTEAGRRGLAERRRLACELAGTLGDRRREVLRFLEREVWPKVPDDLLGRGVPRHEQDEILGEGDDFAQTDLRRP